MPMARVACAARIREQIASASHFPGRSDATACNRTRIVTNQHRTSRRPLQDERRRHQTTRIDTERHGPTRAAADMESNKDLK
jgi:hypothetical protein